MTTRDDGHATFGDIAVGERGSLSLEWAILIVPVMALLFLIFQAGIYQHTLDVARSAAQVGAQAGRTLNAPAGAAQRATTEYLANTGGLDGAQITATTGRDVTVTVTGQVPSIVPLVSLRPITATATMPKELVTAP